MFGVEYDVVELTRGLPPDDTEYQSIVSPVPAIADNITDPAPHLEAPVAEGAFNTPLGFAITAVLTADSQPVVRFLETA